MTDRLQAQVIVEGHARGPLSVLLEPVSFWGGFDPLTGEITDVHHPQHGAKIGETIVAMRSGRGSSSASSVLLEAVRLGSAPLAFILTEPDEILVVGALVGYELYGVATPVLVMDSSDHDHLRNGEFVDIDREGTVISS